MKDIWAAVKDIPKEIRTGLLGLVCNSIYGKNLADKPDISPEKEKLFQAYAVSRMIDKGRIKEPKDDSEFNKVILDIQKKELELLSKSAHQDCTFDIKKHKEEYTNYLEVIIYPDGKIEYAFPSHTIKIMNICSEMEGKTFDELNNEVPQEYYADMMSYWCMKTGCISVWYHGFLGEPNLIQLRKLKWLRLNGVYGGPIHTKKKYNSELEVGN